jgi:hypothetical protein
LNESGNSNSALDFDTTGLAVPNSLLPNLPLNAAVPTSLVELANRGEFAPLVIKSNAIRYVTLTSGVTKDPGSITFAANPNQLFSKRDNKAAVFVSWEFLAKEKVSYTLRLFTADNKIISSSKPQEISLSRSKYSSTSWDLPVGQLAPGIYRVDLLINDKTSWREFIRVTE